MAKGNHRSKMGWFGWSVISVILVTVLGSFLFFFNIFNLDITSLFNGDQASETNEEPISEETREKVKKVQQTVGKEHTDVGQFVSKMHDFYNETTGYGGIAALDWDKQQKQADKVLNALKENIPNVKNEKLTMDLERIQELANAAQKEKKTEHVRYLHRMFHDLDIALNNYKAYDKIWNVTETLKTSN
ncbi:hypothetical protein [Virgibacillus doumboii]|uniref:hypothetical protein n=1 Tax=Virgibacillus doumboii TaxID=2697503 RepID=UPI001FE658FD|nr:hypothetical protein [Virgibacillus doumboii]